MAKKMARKKRGLETGRRGNRQKQRLLGLQGAKALKWWCKHLNRLGIVANAGLVAEAGTDRKSVVMRDKLKGREWVFRCPGSLRAFVGSLRQWGGWAIGPLPAGVTGKDVRRLKRRR